MTTASNLCQEEIPFPNWRISCVFSGLTQNRIHQVWRWIGCPWIAFRHCLSQIRQHMVHILGILYILDILDLCLSQSADWKNLGDSTETVAVGPIGHKSGPKNRKMCFVWEFGAKTAYTLVRRYLAADRVDRGRDHLVIAHRLIRHVIVGFWEQSLGKLLQRIAYLTFLPSATTTSTTTARTSTSMFICMVGDPSD